MTLSAVLLAGGESRRMGRDKATLLLNGTPLWQRQLDLLRQITLDSLLVSARQLPAWLPPDAYFVADSQPSRGPLGGIAAALAAMKTTHLLALAVDMPFMTVDHLSGLWRAASHGCGVLPSFNGSTEPLPAIFPSEAQPIAAGLLTGEDVSLHAFASLLLKTGRMNPLPISAAEAALYTNCNTPADCPSGLVADGLEPLGVDIVRLDPQPDNPLADPK